MSSQLEVHRGLNKEVDVVEDLFVTDHPVAKEQVQNCCPSHYLHCVLGHLIVEGWWHLEEVCDTESLQSVVNEVGNSSNWEEDWDTNSIKHGHKEDIEHGGVFEVDEVNWSTV